MIELALYQPDIAQNAGTIIRMAACFGLRVHIIEPAGFHWSDRMFRRAGMDYLAGADVVRQASWAAFLAQAGNRRLVLLSTRASRSYASFSFTSNDLVLFGRESAGVPGPVHDAADARLLIPMEAGKRSLNVAVAAAMVTGEAMRQLVWGADERTG